MLLQSYFENIIFVASHLQFQDVLDMILVWIIIYRTILLLKQSGTIQVLSGLGILTLAYIFSQWFDLFTLSWILEKFFANLFVIVVVLFQAEIRRALAQIGSPSFLFGSSRVQETQLIEEIAKGLLATSQRGFGALVVIERDILVDYQIEVGTELDAKVSSELIQSVFHPASPVHDGALIIRNGKIHSAGSFLPLSKNPALDKNLGTRHRAAIGLTEETDAIVLVVSEETKSIGIVEAGHLRPNVELTDLRRALYEAYGLKFKNVHQVEAGNLS